MATVTKIKKSPISRYAGQWVAFVGSKIAAHEKTLRSLMKAIDKRGLRREATVFLVPRRDEGPYIL